MAAGDFSASLMYNVQEKMFNMFKGPKTNYGLNIPIPSIMALAEKQQASLKEVMVDNTCVAVDVTFLKDAYTATDTQSIPAGCEITGTQQESAKIQLQDTEITYVQFAIYDDQCKDTYDYAEKLARGMARAKVELEAKLNAKAITFFDANAMDGTHLTIQADEGTLVGDEIQVPKADLNDPEYIGDIHTIASRHKFGGEMFVLSGQTFFKQQFIAQFKSQSCCSLDAAITNGPYMMAFDLVNLDTLLAQQALFVIDPGSYVFWPKNQYTNLAPLNMQDQYNTFIWLEPSARLNYSNGGVLKPVMFDAMRQRKCVKTGENVRWADHFRLTLRTGWSLSPDVYNLGSGIFKYVAV